VNRVDLFPAAAAVLEDFNVSFFAGFILFSLR
jgi:hypothetical protein